MLVTTGQPAARARMVPAHPACCDRHTASMLLQPRLQCRHAFQGRLPHKRCGGAQGLRYGPHQRHSSRGPVCVRAGTVVRTPLARPGAASSLAL